MIYFNKILPLIFSPLFFVLGLIIIGLIIDSKKTSFAGAIILFIFSMPIVSNRLINYLEFNYELKQPSEIESADLIVVLSGMIIRIKTKRGTDFELDPAADRIFAGIDLFKLNKAPYLILTRGKLPWSSGLSEGEYLKKIAIKYGVPEKKIHLTEIAMNTEQEAKSIRKLISKNKTKNNTKIILVTSAFHMPRAQKVFKAAGLDVVPYAVDFRNRHTKISLMSFIPSAHSFEGTSLFFREMIGRTYYNLKY